MSHTAFVLIVEDERDHGEAIAEALQRSDYACAVVEDGAEALASIERSPPDVVVTDYKLGGKITGMDVLRMAKRRCPDTEVILITAYGSEELARDALSRDGDFHAYDYLIKPIDIDVLREKVDRAARKARGARESRLLRAQIDDTLDFDGIIGSAESLRKAIKRLSKIAASKMTVLITGETGTGKELFALAVHRNSPRAGRPFKVLNCAAVSQTLLESELFGHVKGAFTGAVVNREGLIEAAEGGTLFLDEIGDMPLEMQAKLLRTLDSGEVIKVGTNDAQYFDVRFIAATNRELSELAAEGKFRLDLFHRLHANGAIRLPPLRARREDIPALAQRFVEQFNRASGTHVTGIAPEAVRKLVNHGWPGNVRELKNVVELMCIEAEGDTLTVDDLPESLKASTDIILAGPPNLAGMSLKDLERLHIMNTLRMCGGNRERTAKALGIGARTLYRKLSEYGLK
jgi:two-component system response regulator HydG